MKQQLGHYDLVAELGRGGMGVVHKGYEPSLNRYVAIKVLADSLAHDPAIKERFLREARSMAALNDPHIIQIYFIGEDEGQTFFVMEFVDGESLSSVLKREHRLKPEQAAKVIYQTALGLATAHDRGVIHRDVKPGNILIDSRGNVKIADFGIALSSADLAKKLTSTGEFVGTPGYLSPEVCLGKLVDQRSDIFSLGIVLFEMLAGRMPFTDESPLGLMLEVVKAEIPDVCSLNADVDPELSRILSRMIAKEPADRYQSCQELAADLARHPLLANGTTLQLRTQPSPAAATVVGMKTPGSGQNALPNTPPAPRPLPDVTPAPTRVATPPRAQTTLPAITVPDSAHQSLLERQAAASAKNKSGSAALPLAIAALLLLGLGGGAYAYRDQLGFLKQWLPASVAGPTASVPAQVAATATTDTQPVAVPASAPATASPADTQPATSAATTAATVASANVENAAKDANAANSTSAAGGASLADLTGNNASSSAAPAATAAAATSTTSVATDNIAAPAPVESPKPLAPSMTAQTAKATPPPAPTAPPKPHVPTIGITFSGDRRAAEPAARMLKAQLTEQGYVVEMVASRASARGRVDALVIVAAEPTGQMDVSAYGQANTATTAVLNVNVFEMKTGRELSDFSESIVYTGLAAKGQAEEAVQEMAPKIEPRLRAYRPGSARY
ncbi:MAG: serine/threonine-protein kinase [Rudaea sp.]|uniref:serine/threonine-protein kinase n=1 Tax=Rudaea sp. TaxID=2136325 RepID=UPI0039E54BA7